MDLRRVKEGRVRERKGNEPLNVPNVVGVFGAHFSGPSSFINLLYDGRSLKLHKQPLAIYKMSIPCPGTMEE